MRPLSTGTLSLEPLTVAHADEMFTVLSDSELYRHLDHGPPPSVEHLRGVYARLEARASPDGKEGWLNWIVRLPDHRCIGFVQATLVEPDIAWVAFVFARDVWGKGYARASVAAMIDYLDERHARSTFRATTEAANHRSIALLKSLCFHQAAPPEDESKPATELSFVRHIAR